MSKKKVILFVAFIAFMLGGLYGCASVDRQARRKAELDALQKKFAWWPSDAKPSPVKDEERGGYWWWPAEPGQVKPWGNRGYVYLYKIIFDYKSEELPPPKPHELRPSLLIRKILKNVKVYFDYNKSALRQDAKDILLEAVKTLNRNPETDILITGNCDTRGSETYNEKLGRERAATVEKYMLDSGIPKSRIRIISRGKLDAVAPITDLVGMQKDRNAQFMIAQVEEVMMPYEGAPPEEAKKIEEGKYIEEKEVEVERKVKVSTREYTIQKGDTLWKIAASQLGKGYRWKYLYEINKDKIKNPNKLKAGTVITIPIE